MPYGSAAGHYVRQNQSLVARELEVMEEKHANLTKKRRKGARACFDRRKNDERKRQRENRRQIASHERQLLVPLSENCSSDENFDSFKDDAMFSIPDQWQTFVDPNSVEFCHLTRSTESNDTRQVTKSIVIRSDLTWLVKVLGHIVPTTSKLLANYPPSIAPPHVAKDLLEQAHRAAIRQGNPDPEFLLLCRKRGDAIRGERGHRDVVAFLDKKPSCGHGGGRHSATVRRIDCDILCAQHGSYPKRCGACQSFRSTLRSSSSRLSSHEDITSPSSHTTYKNLPAKVERLRRLHCSVRQTKVQLRRLKTRMQQVIEKGGILLDKGDAADMTSLFHEVAPTVEESFPQDFPQRVLWEQQQPS